MNKLKSFSSGFIILSIFLLLFFYTCGCSEKKASALRVCVDVGPSNSSSSVEKIWSGSIDDLQMYANVYGGPADLELEVLPTFGAERDAALERIRT